jgi:hypothetical protein
MMKVSVSRASQVHQMPQTGFAQIGPVIRTTVLKARPTSAAETASQSHSFWRLARKPMQARKETKKAI